MYMPCDLRRPMLQLFVGREFGCFIFITIVSYKLVLFERCTQICRLQDNKVLLYCIVFRWKLTSVPPPNNLHVRCISQFMDSMQTKTSVRITKKNNADTDLGGATRAGGLCVKYAMMSQKRILAGRSSS